MIILTYSESWAGFFQSDGIISVTPTSGVFDVVTSSRIVLSSNGVLRLLVDMSSDWCDGISLMEETTQTKVLAVDARAHDMPVVDERAHDRRYSPLIHKPLDDCLLAENDHVDVD